MPHPEQHQVDLVPGHEAGEEKLLRLGGDQDGVRYDDGRFLFGDGRHVLPFEHDVRLPAEDVGVETEVVLGDVQPTVQEDVFLHGARVICDVVFSIRSTLFFNNINVTNQRR